MFEDYANTFCELSFWETEIILVKKITGDDYKQWYSLYYINNNCVEEMFTMRQNEILTFLKKIES